VRRASFLPGSNHDQRVPSNPGRGDRWAGRGVLACTPTAMRWRGAARPPAAAVAAACGIYQKLWQRMQMTGRWTPTGRGVYFSVTLNVET